VANLGRMRLLSLLAYPFTLGGKASRAAFLGVALGAVLSKWGFDSLILGVYKRPAPGFLHYLISPPWSSLKLHELVLPEGADNGLLIGLLASALIFFWLGLCMTLKRLRAVEWRRGWIVLYLFPLTNVLLFLLLLAPTEAEATPFDIAAPSPNPVPKSDLTLPFYTQGILPVALPALVAFALAALGIKVFPAYATPLFIGIPLIRAW
jgi:uncharacterized membrane protein YhaH (DUF805 family)